MSKSYKGNRLWCRHRMFLGTLLVIGMLGLMTLPAFSRCGDPEEHGVGLEGEYLIGLEAMRFKRGYQEAKPLQAVTEWFIPFNTKNRKNLATVAVLSVFGAPRNSYLRGHRHTATDMIPKQSLTPPEEIRNVYPIANGVVCSIHLGDPHKTVVLKHRLPSGEILFSSYKHLHTIAVEIGEQVGPQTYLGRMYTREEAKALGGNYDHLHLEIRKRFDDYGVASWLTMVKEGLTLRFHDPQIFLKEHVH